MVKRVRREEVKSSVGNYFTRESDLEFVSSGCTLLDCVLGGGWPLGRFSNVVGDKSTGKTLLAIEAAANFAMGYPKGKIYYRESEAAFDEGYAESLGMPLKRVDFGKKEKPEGWATVEDIFEDLTDKIATLSNLGVPGLYIVDSLDALTDRTALTRKIDAKSFALEKQKQMGKLFRELTRDLKSVRMHLMVISQVRTKIGVTFGEKTTRSGGKALDFYASQVLYLSHIQTLKRTIKGNVRAYGVRIRAKCKKNKIGLPFRECDFNVSFGYGTEDVLASLEWLKSVKRLGDMGLRDSEIAEYMTTLDQLDDADRVEQTKELSDIVVKVWREIETDFLPKRRKYDFGG
jgi:recombination protein RecA